MFHGSRPTLPKLQVQSWGQILRPSPTHPPQLRIVEPPSMTKKKAKLAKRETALWYYLEYIDTSLMYQWRRCTQFYFYPKLTSFKFNFQVDGWRWMRSFMMLSSVFTYEGSPSHFLVIDHCGERWTRNLRRHCSDSEWGLQYFEFDFAAVRKLWDIHQLGSYGPVTGSFRTGRPHRTSN